MPDSVIPQPHRGVMILVFGIVGLTVCMPLGIAAWIMGNGDLAAMDRGELDPSGRNLTQAGKVLGIISVVYLILVLLAVGLFLLTALLSHRH